MEKYPDKKSMTIKWENKNGKYEGITIKITIMTKKQEHKTNWSKLNGLKNTQRKKSTTTKSENWMGNMNASQ